MGNSFVHVELHTNDTDRASAFYEELFDWEFAAVPMGEMTYTRIKVGDGVGGGLMAAPGPEAPTQWIPYVEVADVAASIERARDLGATILQDKTPIPGNGHFGILIDPTNAILGVVEHGK